jgi:hypothetical protein
MLDDYDIIRSFTLNWDVREGNCKRKNSRNEMALPSLLLLQQQQQDRLCPFVLVLQQYYFLESRAPL